MVNGQQQDRTIVRPLPLQNPKVLYEGLWSPRKADWSLQIVSSVDVKVTAGLRKASLSEMYTELLHRGARCAPVGYRC